MTQVVKLVKSGTLDYEFFLVIQGTIKEEESYRKKIKIFKLKIDEDNQISDKEELCDKWLSDWSSEKFPDVRIPMYKIYR